jgi:hypothetical protein
VNGGARAGSVITIAAGLGPQSPTSGAPARAAGSMRRTSTVDVRRGDGPAGNARIEARARDLATDTNGGAHVVAAQRILATVEPTLALRAITAEPSEPALEALCGRSVAAGFRAAAARAVPNSRAAADLLYLLLDDLPVATLVSGYAMQYAGLVGGAPVERYAPQVDLCSGWRAGGTLMQVVETHGLPPMSIGPAAPALERPGDVDAWHEMPAPEARMVRRRRRIDVTFGAVLRVDAMFRDSHFDDDRRESVVHEYTLLAEIDAATLTVQRAEATPRVLPYVECPAAAASATRLAGLRLDEVRDRVRAELVGTTTCTHLNDLLRSLEDVRGMHAAAIR